MGLDLGTSSSKGIVIDSDTADVAVADKRTTLLYPRDGWVESDPEAHYRDLCDLISELVKATPGTVSALAFSAASGNTLLADERGDALTPIISWMDRRACETLPEALSPLSAEAVHRVVGWPCVDEFPLAHLAWFRENRRERFQSAEHYCMNTDWILHRLTGQWVMDDSTATTFHLQDQLKRQYHEPYLHLLDISNDKLSRLTQSGVLAGPLMPEAAQKTGLPVGTPIITGCFDHPSAARAVGVLEPGNLMLSCGTSWVGFFPETDREKIIDAGLLCDPFLSGQGGPWGAIFSVPDIGRTVDGYIDHLIAPDEPDRMRVFNESSAESSPGAGGVQIDLREPLRRIDAKRCHISRAVMESAAILLNEEMEALKPLGICFEEAVMVGGPSRSPVWPGIVEEITGLELTVGSAYAGAKGAAILAGIGAGVYKNEEEALYE